MRIHVEINSIDELAAIFAIIRGEELDADRLAQVASVLEASKARLTAAHDAAQP